jgi:hypothetical protein
MAHGVLPAGAAAIGGLEMGRYGEAAQKSVESAMRRRKRGTLQSGGSGRTVKSRKQAIAIGLSEARKKGAKVPARRSASAARSGRKAGARKSTRGTASRKHARSS